MTQSCGSKATRKKSRHDSRVSEESGFSLLCLSVLVPGGFADLWGGKIMKDVALIMQRALDGAWRRHEVLANNVANAETPGYKRLDLGFRSALAEATSKGPTLLTTSPRHISPSRPSQEFRLGQDLSAITPDGNSVDIDREMGEVSTNALYYSAVSAQLNAYLSLLRKAITEGRR